MLEAVNNIWSYRSDAVFLRSTVFLLQLARKFPDIGRVKVDKFGDIIGGVNPFEGTDIKLEDQPRIDDKEEVRANQLSSILSTGGSLC